MVLAAFVAVTRQFPAAIAVTTPVLVTEQIVGVEVAYVRAPVPDPPVVLKDVVLVN